MSKRPPSPPASPPPKKRQTQESLCVNGTNEPVSDGASAIADGKKGSGIIVDATLKLQSQDPAVKSSSAVPSQRESSASHAMDQGLASSLAANREVGIGRIEENPVPAQRSTMEMSKDVDPMPVQEEVAGYSATLNTYQQFRVSVLVSSLNVPKLTVRPFMPDAAEVNEFRLCFKNGLYGEGDRLISVILSQESSVSAKDVVESLSSLGGEAKNMDVQSSIEKKPLPRLTNLPGVKLLVADGLHRLQALRTYRGPERNRDPLWCDAYFFVRRDGRRMSMADCHTIGSRLNRMDRAGREPTPYDHIHSCLSTLLDVQRMSALEIEDTVMDDNERKHFNAVRKKPNPSNLRVLVSKRGILGVSAWRSIWRYCQIALGLYQFMKHPEIAEMVRDSMQKGKASENRGASLATIERPELWSSSSVRRFKFVFSSYLRVRKDCELKEKLGPKLVSCLSGLWDMAIAFCNGKGLELEKGLDVSVRIPARGRGRNAISGHETVVERLHVWVGQIIKEHITKETVWEARLKTYRTNLESNWPSDTELERSGFLVLKKCSEGDGDNAEHAIEEDLSSSAEKSCGPASLAAVHGVASVEEVVDRSAALISQGVPPELPVPTSNTGTAGHVAFPKESTIMVPESQPNEAEKTTITESESRLDHFLDEIIADCNSSVLMNDPEHLESQSLVHGGANESPLQGAVQDHQEKGTESGTPGVDLDRGAKESTGDGADGSGPVEGTNASPPTPAGGKKPVVSPYSLRNRPASRSAERTVTATEGEEGRGSRSGQGSGASGKRGRSGGSGRRPPSGKPKRTGERNKKNRDVGKGRPAVDKDGFRILKRLSTGFTYKRPILHDGGYRSYEFKRGTEDGEPSGYVATLLDGTEVNVYPDMFETKVSMSKFWQLEELPASDARIWLEKYKVPDGVDSLLKYKGAGDKEAYLRSLGFRPPHQSHFRLSMEDVSQVRFSVFEYLALDLEIGEDPAGWQRAMDNHMQQKREVLNEKGFIVFNGFVKRDMEEGESDVDREEYLWKDMFCEVERLFDFFAKDVPKAEAEYTADKQKFWARIRNEDKLPVGVPVSDSRWTSRPYSTNDRLAEINENLLEARCFVGVATWILAHWLHLEPEHFEDISQDNLSQTQKPEMPPLSATDSGSRVFVTSADCSPQRPHMDYIHPEFVQEGEYPETIRFPGYFSISTGPEACLLYVLHGSHKFIFCSVEDKKNMSKIIGLTPIEIPAWSTIIARGDFIHAGVEGAGEGGEGCVRLHDYLLRKGIPFADQINDEGIWRLFREVRKEKNRMAAEKRQQEGRPSGSVEDVHQTSGIQTVPGSDDGGEALTERSAGGRDKENE